MKTLKEKELALLSIRNLHRYLDGEIKKEEWRENMRRIEDCMGSRHMRHGGRFFECFQGLGGRQVVQVLVRSNMIRGL